MRVPGIVAKSSLAILFVAFVAVAGIGYFSSPSLAGLMGRWEIVSTWSDNDYLARRNVHPGTEIIIDEHGFLKAGRLGLDGIVGPGSCGVGCATFAVNGFPHEYQVRLAGKFKSNLIMTSGTPPAVIVAQKVK